MTRTLWAVYIVFTVIALTRCQQRSSGALATDEGGKLFGHYCSRCHLGNGIGGPSPVPGVNAPDIRQFTKSESELVPIIKNGFGQMPGFGDSTSQENIALIASYVVAQIELHPPHNATSGNSQNP